MDFSFKCSACGAKNTTAVDMIGNMMHCAMCESEVEVPLTGFSSGMVEGNYWIHSLVGTGSISEVYVTKLMSADGDQGGRVYMKVMSPLATVDKTATHDFFQRICQSAQVIHPNILSVIDTGIMHGHYFAATPYVEGDCLDTIIDRDGPLDEPDALKICLRVARLMQQVWNEQGLVHQALKPANILINDEGEVFLLDLCNSKQCLVPADDRLESINPKGNLFDYMSPEQIQDLPDLDPTSDIYSLGASLHFMICGEKPYTDTMTSSIAQKHLWSAPPQLEAHKRDVSPEVADLVRWMMSGRGAGQPRTWEELIARIRPIYKKQSKRSASTKTRPKIKTAIHTKSGGISRREAGSSTQAIRRRKGAKASTQVIQREENVPEPTAEVIQEEKKGRGALIVGILAAVFTVGLAVGGAIWLANRDKGKSTTTVKVLRLDDELLERRLRRARTYGKSSKMLADRYTKDLEGLQKLTKDEEQLNRLADLITLLESIASARAAGPTTHTISAEADAYIQGGKSASKNFGGQTSMAIKNGGENNTVDRRAYLRFDLSKLPPNVTSAKLRLYSHGMARDAGTRGIQLVSDDKWQESKVTYKNCPKPSGKDIATFEPLNGKHIELDLTAAVKHQRARDKKISLFIYARENTGGLGMSYVASREHTNAEWRPVLIVQCGQKSKPKPTTPIAKEQRPYGGKPWPIPGSIKASYYDEGGEGVAYHDTTPENESNKTFRQQEQVDASDWGVGWIRYGEWLEYTVNVQKAEAYEVKLHIYSAANEGQIRIEFGGKDKTETVEIPAKVPLNNITVPVNNLKLEAGRQVMRVFFIKGGFNLNRIEFTAATSTKPAATKKEAPQASQGLRGEYFSNTEFKGTPIVRIDPRIKFSWKLGAPIADVPKDRFSVRWTGSLTVPKDGKYKFELNADDQGELQIDGKVHITFEQKGRTASVDLKKGQRYPIRVRFIEGRGAAIVHLFWSGPGFDRQYVPARHLFPKAVPPPTTNSTRVVAAINCGGEVYTAKDGTKYSADKYYSGGKPYEWKNAIAGTDDDILYHRTRFGAFTYTIPVRNGDYAVTLKMCENYRRESGKRKFDVKIEGKQVINDLDLFAVAGNYKAYDRTFKTTVKDGKLTIQFINVRDNATVTAILVTKQE